MTISINTIIAQRRSIYPKEYTGEKADDSIIHTLLKNAHWAPSHHNTFPWRFKVMKGQSLEAWAEYAAMLYKEYTAPEKFRQEKMDKILQYPKLVSHVIAVCMKRDETGKVPEIEEICAVACAVENMYLSLSQYPDIGGYWSTGNGTFSQQMKAWFKLGEQDKLMGYFFIGKLKEKRTESNRRPYDDFVEWL